jgi:molybdopterin synthase sulfur carrier subunit
VTDSVLISIKTYANLRSIIGEEVLMLRVQGSPTVREALNCLVERYGQQVEGHIRGDRIAILLNGRNVSSIKGADTEIQEGDMITVLPVLSGG